MQNTLRVRRAERAISQNRLALDAGLRADRYFRIEIGYAEPTPAEMEAIATALGVSVRRAFPRVRTKAAS